METTARITLAPSSALTDARGQKSKGPFPVGLAAQERAMVSQSEKPTGVSVDSTRAGLTPTHPGKRTHLKLAKSLSLRSPFKSRHGAGDERPTIRETSPSH